MKSGMREEEEGWKEEGGRKGAEEEGRWKGGGRREIVV
jgi:hypothetical protein